MTSEAITAHCECLQVLQLENNEDNKVSGQPPESLLSCESRVGGLPPTVKRKEACNFLSKQP